MEQGYGEEQSAAIRVLVANLPGDLSSRLAQLVREQPDMRLIDTVSGNVDLLLAAADGIDIVILGASPVYPLPAICTHLLSEFANLRIIVVGGREDASAMLYWLGLRRWRQRAFPLNRLLASIRDAHQRNPLE